MIYDFIFGNHLCEKSLFYHILLQSGYMSIIYPIKELNWLMNRFWGEEKYT